MCIRDSLNAKITGFDLIINTTPVGTFPNVNSILEIPYDLIDSSHTCYDLIYNPKKTSFLIESEKKGAYVINGLPMLEYQAEDGIRDSVASRGLGDVYKRQI